LQIANADTWFSFAIFSAIFPWNDPSVSEWMANIDEEFTA
jgi:hypothetical protein